MTTTVNIFACGDNTKQVRVRVTGQPDRVLAAGGSETVVIYDQLQLTVSEELVQPQAGTPSAEAATRDAPTA